MPDLVASYRLLVGALLEHSALHEGTDEAIADFATSGDRAAGILQQIYELQQVDA